MTPEEAVRRAVNAQQAMNDLGVGKPPAQDISDAELERRFTYHAPSGEAKEFHGALRAEAKAFARRLQQLLPAGREKSLAFTAFEEATFWAHAAIARDPSLHEEGGS